MNQSETIGKLATAVCAVVAERGYVKADAKNEHFNYNYLSDEAVLDHVRGSMAKNGLMLVPNRVEHSIIANGKGDIVTTTTTYILAHTSGEWMEVQILAQGQDRADKGPYKAATGALKYALRNVFLIPTGDDPEKARQAEEDSAKKELGINPKHSLWWGKGGHKWACAQLTTVNLNYEGVAAWCEAQKWGRPSGWSEQDVRKLVADLITPDSKARQALDGWAAAQKGAAA
jgi:hypothetical protein